MAKKMSSKSEWRRYQKFEQENEKLRKEVSKLRKQVRTSLVDKLEERSDRVREGKPAILPTCENCGNEDVEFIPIKRTDGNFEIKVCKTCQHKSKMKQKK